MGGYAIDGVRTFPFTRIIGLEHIQFGHDIIIDDFVFIYAKKRMKIGNYVHIGCFSSITGGEEFVMDDFSGLSAGCRIFTGSEDLKGWGFGNPTIGDEYRNVRRVPVRLERFVLIGTNSVILPGVTIGEGATVGACSVVTRDLEPWGVYIGNRRVAERDQEGVKDNYRKFLSVQTDKA